MATTLTDAGQQEHAETLPTHLLQTTEARCLSDADVLAILLGRGSCTPRSRQACERLLHAVDNDIARMASLTPAEMAALVGHRNAINVLAALELGRRRIGKPGTDRLQFRNSRTAYEHLLPKLIDLQHEEFWMILLNRGMREICTMRISIGGLHGTVADPKCIFKAAIDKRASCIMVAHNHPSGQTRPSEEDISLTRKLTEGGRMLDILVQDHIIVTNDGYYSFADNGQM